MVADFRWKVTSHTKHTQGDRKLKIALSWYKNIASTFCGLVTKHACDRQTDGQTDGHNFNSHDSASIAAYCVTRQ